MNGSRGSATAKHAGLAINARHRPQNLFAICLWLRKTQTQADGGCLAIHLNPHFCPSRPDHELTHLRPRLGEGFALNSSFLADLEQVGKVLQDRIRREEEILYPLYVPFL